MIIYFSILIFCFLQVLISSMNGFSLFEDSANYIFMARNLFKFLAFDTQTYEITKAGHFPIGYPFLIWLFKENYLILNSILLSISSLSLFIILNNYFDKIKSFLFTLLFIIQSPIIYFYNSIMSESFFISDICLVLLFWFLLEKTNKKIYFILLLLFLSIAPLIRHIGIILIFSIVFYFFIKRKYTSSLMVLISIIPYVIFLNFSNLTREIVFHPSFAQDFKNIIKSFAFFVYYKISLSNIVGLIYLILFLYALYKLHKFEKNFFLLSSIFILFYIGFILLTSTYLAAGVKNQFPRFIIAITPVTFLVLSLSRSRISLILLLVSSFFGFFTLIKLNKEPERYASKIWKNSPSLNFIKNLNKPYKIYSNHPPAVYLISNKISLYLPVKKNYITLELNQNYDKNFNQMIDEVKEGKAIIHFVKRYNYDNMPSKDTLLLLLKNYIKDFEDAYIFIKQ